MACLCLCRLPAFEVADYAYVQPRHISSWKQFNFIHSQLHQTLDHFSVSSQLYEALWIMNTMLILQTHEYSHRDLSETCPCYICQLGFITLQPRSLPGQGSALLPSYDCKNVAISLLATQARCRLRYRLFDTLE